MKTVLPEYTDLRLAKRMLQLHSMLVCAVSIAVLTMFITLAHSSLGVAAGPPLDIGHLHALLFGPTDGALWIGTHNGLFRSSDEGKSWQPVKIPADLAAMDFMNFIQDPANPKVLYVGPIIGGSSAPRMGGRLGQRSAPVSAGRMFTPWPWTAMTRRGRNDCMLGWWTRASYDGPSNPDVRALQAVNIRTGMGGIFIYAATSEGIFRGPDCF
jgi:hypothetical protein